jgi:hypothetical protein
MSVHCIDAPPAAPTAGTPSATTVRKVPEPGTYLRDPQGDLWAVTEYGEVWLPGWNAPFDARPIARVEAVCGPLVRVG